MPPARHSKVSELIEAAIVGMEEIPDTTATEVASAALTLALRVVQTTLRQHPEQRGQIKEAVSVILMECADLKQN